MKRFACIVLITLAAVPAAAAKEGAQAHLLKPLPRNAPPRTFIMVHWSVDVPAPNGKREGLSAIGMFVRLISRTGASTTAQSSENVGPPYSARIRVPTGGIRTVRFGIAGSTNHYFPLK